MNSVSLSCPKWHESCLACTTADASSWAWDPSCSFCNTADTGSCTRCATSYYYQPAASANYPWALDCPSGWTPDISTYACVEWHDSCDGWVGQGNTNCIACDPGYFQQPIPNENQWLTVCDDGYWQDSTTNSCQVCKPWCDTWHDDTRCITCSLGYFLQPDAGSTECRVDCPDRSWPNSSTQEWDDCDLACVLCTGAGNTKCNGCDSGYYAQPAENSSTCLTTCTTPIGYWPDTVNNIWEICNNKCQLCTGGDSTQWTACNSGYFMQPSPNNTTCDDICPDGYYADGPNKIWVQCDVACGTCHESGHEKWDTCATNYYLQPASTTCLNDCSDGNYKDDVNWECVRCDAAWATWFHGRAFNCDTCAADYYEQPGSFNTVCLRDFCQIGYYKTTTQTCLPCNSKCTECFGEHDYECSVCAEDFYMQHPVESSATCADSWTTGYYKDDVAHICGTCHEDWESCNDGDGTQTGCIACRDPNAAFDDSGVCAWPNGFFVQSSAPLACGICHETWVTWYGPTDKDCVTCYIHANLSSGTWSWDIAWFPNPNSRTCGGWDSTCQTCTTWVSTACTSCYDYGYVTDEGKCDHCEDGSYYSPETATCEPCAEDCATCSDVVDFWLTCVDSEKEVNSQGLWDWKVCPDGTYRNNRAWDDCRSTCAKCIQKNEWTACNSFAYLDASRSWVCQHGYDETGQGCVKDEQGPEVRMELMIGNRVKIEFLETLGSNLTASDIESVDVTGPRKGGYDYTWSLVIQEDFTIYILELSFDPEDIPTGTQVSLKFADSIGDTYGNPVVDPDGSVGLLEVEVDEDEPDHEALLWLDKISGIFYRTVATLGFVSCVITGSFGPLWTYLNALEILSLIPLMENSLPNVIETVLKSPRDFLWIPNAFEYWIDSSELDGDPPYDQADDYGFDTSIFIMNSGKILTSAMTICVLMPFVAILACIFGRHSPDGWFMRTNRSYFVGFFLRAQIQTFLIVFLSSMFQILDPSYDNEILKWNTIFGYIFMGLSALTPMLVAIFLLVNRYKLFNDVTLLQRFGTYFAEFKNDRGIPSIMFYPWFFLRRILYVIILIFLRDFVMIQFILNFLHSFATLLFVLKYVPYNSQFTNYTHSIQELCIVIMFIVWFSYEFEYESEGNDLLIRWAACGFVFSTVLVGIANLVFSQMQAFKLLMQKSKHQHNPSGVSKISDISGITTTPVKGMPPIKGNMKPSNISLDVNIDHTVDETQHADQTVDTGYESVRPPARHEIQPERLSRKTLPNPIHQNTPSLPHLPDSKFEEPRHHKSLIEPRHKTPSIEPHHDLPDLEPRRGSSVNTVKSFK